ncbi:MAG: pirin family protein [Leptospiraceae bacterium]|nr:pirin family protein [Leptospiraceae bacterium]
MSDSNMVVQKTLHRSASRGGANFGWLQSRHTFSFGGYFNPERVHFGALRVLNDDLVAPGSGFPTHPHDNMEIITIPLEGALEHKDTTGTDGVIRTGDVQIMSAGTGIAHSEYNHSDDDPVKFLQIWVLPAKRDIEPRYEQKTFVIEDRKNRFQTIVSPDPAGDALWINQQAYFSLAELDKGQELHYEMKNPANGVYFFLIEGSATVGEETLGYRDGLGVEGLASVPIKATSPAQILAMEVPMA